LSLPRTRYGGIQCFQAVIDSAPIFIGVTRRNDVSGRFSKVSNYFEDKQHVSSFAQSYRCYTGL
jgi:hypothetical protein